MALQCIDPLLILALQASDDPDALPVLGDYLLENELPRELWVRVWRLIHDNSPKRHFSEQYAWRGKHAFDTPGWAAEYVAMNGSTPTPTFARAVVAVLMTAAWQETPWWTKLQQKCSLYSTAFGVNGRLLEEVRELSFDSNSGRIQARIPGLYLSISEGND